MKLAMQLTTEAIIRVLKLRAHSMADDVEHGYARSRLRPVPRQVKRERATIRRSNDDVSGD